MMMEGTYYGGRYDEWLAREKKWYTTTEKCGECYGRGRIQDPALAPPPQWGEGYWSQSRKEAARRRWRKWRAERLAAGLPEWLMDEERIPCPTCGGGGRVALEEPTLDLERVAAYMGEQRYSLQRQEDAAMERLLTVLMQRGADQDDTGCYWCFPAFRKIKIRVRYRGQRRRAASWLPPPDIDYALASGYIPGEAECERIADDLLKMVKEHDRKRALKQPAPRLEESSARRP